MIPTMLKDQKKWVCWKKEKVKDRITKVPYNPQNGKKAKSTDAQTWSSYEEAVEAKGYDGIGYVFNGDGIFGIDIDHCITSNNKIEKDAALLIEKLKSYTEKSPSGEGIHIYGICHTKNLEGRRQGKYEMYFTGRYFTVTGRAIQFSDQIRDLTDEMDYILENYFPKKKPANTSKSIHREPISLSDKELLEKIFSWKNGDILRSMYEGNDPKFDGDKSRNDFYFVNTLNFANGNDLEQTDRIFRGSGRMRRKYDEKHYSNGETYGERLLKDAMDIK